MFFPFSVSCYLIHSKKWNEAQLITIKEICLICRIGLMRRPRLTILLCQNISVERSLFKNK